MKYILVLLLLMPGMCFGDTTSVISGTSTIRGTSNINMGNYIPPPFFIVNEDFEVDYGGAPPGWTQNYCCPWNYHYTASPLVGTASLQMTNSNASVYTDF